MKRPLSLPFLFPLLVLAACGENQPPTAPTSHEGPGALIGAAAPRVVNSLADPGDGVCNASQCTLREAINDPGSTEISFAPGLTGTITLARPTAGGGTLRIDKALSIVAPSAGITIRRRTTDPAFRIFTIGSSGNVTLRRLTIRDGKAAAGGGGGIINFGTLRLNNSTVAVNVADFGGGIDNHGRLVLTNSTVARNSGGGIENHNDFTLILTNSTVANNAGFGVLNSGGALTLSNSTVGHNSRTGVVAIRGTSTLTRVTVLGNSGGGIFLGNGELTLTNSTVARNSGGSGVGNGSGDLTILKSTIADNSSPRGGGGISNENDNFCRQGATVSVSNSTVSGNSAPHGGGILDVTCGSTNSFVQITHSTIVRNSATLRGGGISEESDEGSIVVRNSIVAQNQAPTGSNVFGSVAANSTLIGGNPRIGPLADNGGPTRTHALLANSPAIDAASTADCLPTDQRGVSRPQGPGCDMGSYERE
jgi:CSLREA domain-containing protein